MHVLDISYLIVALGAFTFIPDQRSDPICRRRAATAAAPPPPPPPSPHTHTDWCTLSVLARTACSMTTLIAHEFMEAHNDQTVGTKVLQIQLYLVYA